MKSPFVLGKLLGICIFASSVAGVHAGTILVDNLTYTIDANAKNHVITTSYQNIGGPLVQQTFSNSLNSVTSFSQTATATGITPTVANAKYTHQTSTNSSIEFISNQNNIVGNFSAYKTASTNYNRYENTEAIGDSSASVQATLSFEVVGSPVLFFYYRRAGIFTASPVIENYLTITHNGDAVTLSSAKDYYGYFGKGGPGQDLFEADFPDVYYNDTGWYYTDADREGYLALLQPGTGYQITVDIVAPVGDIGMTFPPFARQGVTTFAFTVPEASSFLSTAVIGSGVGFVMMLHRKKRPSLSKQ